MTTDKAADYVGDDFFSSLYVLEVDVRYLLVIVPPAFGFLTVLG